MFGLAVEFTGQMPIVDLTEPSSGTSRHHRALTMNGGLAGGRKERRAMFRSSQEQICLTLRESGDDCRIGLGTKQARPQANHVPKRKDTMATEIGAYEAKRHLPELLLQVGKGKPFVIANRGQAVAELVPVARRRRPPQRARPSRRKRSCARAAFAESTSRH